MFTLSDSINIFCCSVAQVVSDSLPPHELQHTRLPYPSQSPRVCSNSCPLSLWCYLTISSSATIFSLLSIFPSIRVFFNQLALRIRWPKYWCFSFSICPPNEWKAKCQSLSHVQLFATPWTVAHQVPLSRRFPRQEYWSGLLFPSPGTFLTQW